MTNFNEITDILNSVEKQISDCIVKLEEGKNSNHLYVFFNDNYYYYLNNQYTDVNGYNFTLKETNFDSFFNKTFTFLKEQSNFISDLKNLNYLKIENNKLSKYTEKLIKKCMKSIQEYNYCLFQNNVDFFHILNKPNLKINYSGLLILEDFYKYEENIVLIGGNGCGKTSLANALKGNDSDSIAVIPAQKNLYFSLNDYSLLKTDVNEVKNLLFENNIIKGKSTENNYDYRDYQNNNFTRLIVGMQDEFISYLIKCEDNGEKPDKNHTIFRKVTKVFEILFPDIKLNIENGHSRSLSCEKSGNKYNVNSLSEGEKAVLYYSISVFIAKENSIIIIDEPETYINPSVANTLWDTLEQERSDCQFFYITHSVDFVLGRSNKKIAWIKNYCYPSHWEFDILENENDLPKPMLTEILGTKKPIIFCEGDDKSSLDYHIYKSILQNDYTVIPVNGHQQVISYCKTLNKINFDYKAYGIIDGDMLSQEQINDFKNNNIFVLPFNEIEMFILEEKIIEETVSKTYPLDYQNKINAFKDEFWKYVNIEKKRIALSYVKAKIEEYLENHKIRSTKKLEDMKKDLTNITNLDLDKLFNTKMNEIDKIIKNKNYEELLKICNLKKEITKSIATNCLDKDYEEKAKQRIAVDKELQLYLRDEYFSFL